MTKSSEKLKEQKLFRLLGLLYRSKFPIKGQKYEIDHDVKKYFEESLCSEIFSVMLNWEFFGKFYLILNRISYLLQNNNFLESEVWILISTNFTRLKTTLNNLQLVLNSILLFLCPKYKPNIIFWNKLDNKLQIQKKQRPDQERN